MYSEQWIKQAAETAAYYRGMQLYRNDMVQNLEIQDMIGNLYIEATVLDDETDVFYTAGFVYDSIEDKMMEYYCDCKDFPEINGPCSHCVALFSEYLNRYNQYDSQPPEIIGDPVSDAEFLINMFEEMLGDIPPFIKEKYQNSSSGNTGNSSSKKGKRKPQKRQTTPALHELMARDSQKKLLPVMDKEQFGKIKLIPYIVHDNREGLCAEFRVGATTAYVIKDIVSFVQSIQKGERVKYGKKLEFVHSPNMFARECQPLLHFIINWYRYNEESLYDDDYYYGYSYGYSYRKVRKIHLSSEYIDNFFDAVAETGY